MASRILIIDDDVQVRALLRAALSPHGYEVVLAADGQAGVRAYREAPADLVITDVFMPEKDGLEAITELRAANPNLKIIAMTGGGSAGLGGMLHMATLLGAECTLSKPFTPSELVATVKRVLGTSGESK